MSSGGEVVINTPRNIRRMAGGIQAAGALPEIELFDSGDCHLARPDRRCPLYPIVRIDSKTTTSVIEACAAGSAITVKSINDYIERRLVAEAARRDRAASYRDIQSRP
jgi:hypothetical protein